MPSPRTIEVSCACGQALARYQKGGKGRLVKMFLRKIVIDRAGVFLTEPQLQLNDELACPACAKRIATVQVIRGQYAAKVNQGAVRVR